ncbi:hypothetical protein [Christensenella massiliensis]|jgi:acyl carrier protein|uniref:STAS domain-containing protein n=1 Tax=Christensenella massiliensis TaxID=1805714 RepID=A0AAU8ACA2_9FIRM
MEKVIKIGDKDVRLKANAMQAIIYRREFGRDIMEVQGSIMKMMNFDKAGNATFNLDGIGNLDSVGIVQVIWTMAKAADASVPPLEQWLEQFDAFPIMDVFAETYELILANFISTTRIKNRKAAGSSRRKG